MNVTIRPARPEDIPAMCDLLEALFAIETGFQPDVVKQVSGLALLVGDPRERAHVLVAVHEEKVVGMASVQLVASTAEGGWAGLVEDVVVDEGFRCRGAGTLLLDGIISWSKSRGLTRLQLLADNKNHRALDFYSSRGWIASGFVSLRKMP